MAIPASFTTTTFPSAVSAPITRWTATRCHITSLNPGARHPPLRQVTPAAADLINFLPNAAGIINGTQPFTLGDYNRANKLPYSINFTLDLEWQPRNDLMVDLSYVGNLGRHQVIPLPFNQAQIATPGSPTHPGGTASFAVKSALAAEVAAYSVMRG